MPNPYNRRGVGPLMGVAVRDSLSPIAVGGELAASVASPVEFHDIEAMVHSAHRRGYEEARTEAAREERVACHRAWEQGHAAGVKSERAELLALIDEKFGAEVRDTHARALAVLEGITAGEARKRDAVHVLRIAASLLASLIDSHHAGFEELPF